MSEPQAASAIREVPRVSNMPPKKVDLSFLIPRFLTRLDERLRRLEAMLAELGTGAEEEPQSSATDWGGMDGEAMNREADHGAMQRGAGYVAVDHGAIDAAAPRTAGGGAGLEIQTTMETMMREFHSLAGIGSTYGFPDVSRISREGELLLRVAITAGRQLSSAEKVSIRNFVGELESIRVAAA